MVVETARLVSSAASTDVGGRSIPSLDGLRALSVGAVVLSHVVLHRLRQPYAPLFAAVSVIGPLGVRVFFVISGYLITMLLIHDEERFGGVRLGRFYLRRVLRIFPPFYAYLLAITLMTAGGALPAAGRAWPAWAYLSNILPTENWYTAHSWSLAIEEQFYLTWPFVLAYLGRRRAARIAVWACVAMPLIRVGVAILTGSGWIGANVAFDFLALGCLLALHPPELERILHWSASRGRLLVALIVCALFVEGVLTISGRLSVALELGVVEGAEAVLIALVIMWCVAHPASTVGRILNARPMRIIGIGSYSIYLWQQLFFGPLLSAYTVPGAVLATAAAAGASYLLVERPSLALRHRIEGWWMHRQANAAAAAALGST